MKSDRALQVLEGADPTRFGKGTRELLRRLERVSKMIQVKKR